MSFVENAAKRQEEAKQAGTGPEMKHKETLKQILANEKQSALFAEYLRTEGKEDLAETVASGNFDVSGDDENRLTEERRTFLEIIERSDNVIESLSDQSLKDFIAASPELTKVAERNGPEGIRNVIKSQLPKMAITDRGRFEDLSRYATNIAKKQERGGEINEEIKEAFKDDDISNEKIEKLIQGGEEGKAVARELAEEIRAQMSGSERFFGNKKSQIEAIQQRLESLASMKAADIRDYLAELANDRKKLGDAVGLALIENPVLHEALIADLRSEAIKGPEQEASFKDGRSILEYDQNAALAMWERKRDAYRSRNEQDIYNYHQEEWLASERAKGWDEDYDKNLKAAFAAEMDSVSKDRQKLFKEQYINPYMTTAGITSEADIQPVDMEFLKGEFTLNYGVLEIDDATNKSSLFSHPICTPIRQSERSCAMRSRRHGKTPCPTLRAKNSGWTLPAKPAPSK
jgi:hypothetical protein